MKEIEKIRYIRAETYADKMFAVIKNEPVTTTTRKNLPNISVQPKQCVAMKAVGAVRLKSKDQREYAWQDFVLIEPAMTSIKKGDEYVDEKADAGTEVAMNMKRHSGLWRQFEKHLVNGTADGKELVIANLGKRTFKTDKAPSGKATGYDYRVMLLSELKAKMKEK